MKVAALAIFVAGFLCEVLSQNFGGADEDDFLDAGSGSGHIPIDEPSVVYYKELSIKLTTKYNFLNPEASMGFSGEVCDEVTKQMNKDDGPLNIPGRPTIFEIDQLNISPRSNPSSPLRMNVRVFVPEQTRVDDYIEKLKTNPFFTKVNLISQGDSKKAFLEHEIEQFVSTRLAGVPDVDITLPEKPIEERPRDVKPGNNNNNNNGGQDDNKIDGVIIVPRHEDFFRNPATLAAIAAAAVAGLFCTILCTVFVVYRMRKKDEGSYALDEPKHKYKHEIYIASTKEFFA